MILSLVLFMFIMIDLSDKIFLVMFFCEDFYIEDIKVFIIRVNFIGFIFLVSFVVVG